MRKMNIFLVIAGLLIIIGVIGSLLTFPGIPSISGKDLTTSEKEIDSAEVETIKINIPNGKVQVLPTSEKEIKVNLQTGDKNDELITNIVDNALNINIKNKSWASFSIGFFNIGTTLTVYVPEQHFELLDIKSDNGKINIEEIEANNINVQSSNGRIELSEITADKATVNADNGKIILTNVSGEITGKTSNGSIAIYTKTLEYPIDFHADNGKITITSEELPTNNTFDLRTDFGKIQVYGKKDWDSVIGNGEHLIKLRTNNGKITIQQPE